MLLVPHNETDRSVSSKNLHGVQEPESVESMVMQVSRLRLVALATTVAPGCETAGPKTSSAAFPACRCSAAAMQLQPSATTPFLACADSHSGPGTLAKTMPSSGRHLPNSSWTPGSGPHWYLYLATLVLRPTDPPLFVAPSAAAPDHQNTVWANFCPNEAWQLFRPSSTEMQ